MLNITIKVNYDKPSNTNNVSIVDYEDNTQVSLRAATLHETIGLITDTIVKKVITNAA